MRRFKTLAVTLAVLLGLAPVLTAPPVSAATARVDTIPLAIDWDLDVPTEVADDDQIVTVVDLTNTSFTVAASPDVPREVIVVIVDTTPSITAGTVTVTGTDINDNALVWAIDISGGAGTYNSIDPAESGDLSYLFKTVTDVTADSVATLGGGGDETIKVGTGNGAVAPIYCSTLGGPSAAYASSRTWRKGIGKVSSTALSTTVTSTGSVNSFANVAVGDPLYFRNSDGSRSYTYVTARASANSITVKDPQSLTETGGHDFWFRTRYCDYGDNSGWVNTEGAAQVTVSALVSQMTVTNDIVRLIECRQEGFPSYYHNVLQEVDISSVADTDNVPYTLTTACKEVRVGWIVAATGAGANLIYGYNPGAGTDDGTDTGTALEKITAYVTVVEDQNR